MELDQPLKLGSWLAACGDRVMHGERIVEIVGVNVVIDLPSPVDGRMVEQLASEDDVVQVGQILGFVESEP